MILNLFLPVQSVFNKLANFAHLIWILFIRTFILVYQSPAILFCCSCSIYFFADFVLLQLKYHFGNNLSCLSQSLFYQFNTTSKVQKSHFVRCCYITCRSIYTANDYHRYEFNFNLHQNYRKNARKCCGYII